MTTMTIDPAAAIAGGRIITDSDAILITPAIAEAWLRHNVENRTLSKSKVDDYSRQLRNGDWRLSPDAICFNVDGKLISGQHRLTAIVQTGIPAEFFVASLDHRDTVLITDTGKARTLGDILAIKGEKQANALAAVLTLLWRYERALNRGSGHWGDFIPKPSANEVLEVLDRNPFARDWASFGPKYHKKFRIGPALIASFGAVFEHASSRDDAVTFWLGVFDPSTPDIRGVLSRRLLRDMAAKGGAKLPRGAVSKLVVKAWNSYATDGGHDAQRMTLGAAETMQFPVRLSEWSSDQV